MNIKTILQNKDAVSLMLLSQINFQAGLDMMSKLRADKKARNGKTEADIHPDHSVEDEFADIAPAQKKIPQLDISTNLVGATVLLASEVQRDDLEFLKRNIRSPKQIIVSQMDWIADQEANKRLATAAKFGLQVSVDKFLAQIKASQQEPTVEYITEAQSALRRDIRSLDTRHLIHLIEETYNQPKWLDKLKDSAIGLYEAAAKRIEAGKFADLPDELVQFAQDVLKERGKMAQA